MRGFTQNRQIGTALPPAVMNRIPRQNGGSGAMGDQDRQHSVTNAGLYRGARPNPGAVRLATI